MSSRATWNQSVALARARVRDFKMASLRNGWLQKPKPPNKNPRRHCYDMPQGKNRNPNPHHSFNDFANPIASALLFRRPINCSSRTCSKINLNFGPGFMPIAIKSSPDNSGFGFNSANGNRNFVSQNSIPANEAEFVSAEHVVFKASATALLNATNSRV